MSKRRIKTRKLSLYYGIGVFILLTSCATPSDMSITPDSLDSIPADGVSTLRIKAILKNSQSLSPTITFTTDHGAFAGSTSTGAQTVTVGAMNDSAVAILTSSTTITTPVIITISGNGPQVYKQVSFTPSYPELVVFNSSTYFIKLDGTVTATVTLNLSKQRGVVSDHFPIDLSIDSVFKLGPNYGVDLPSRVYVDKQVVSFPLHNVGTDTSYFRIKARYATSATGFDSTYMHVYVR